MHLVRHAHSCVSVVDGDRRLLVDPGTFTPDASALLAKTGAVLVTHEHFDHLDVDAVRAALAVRADLRVYAPASVAAVLGKDAAGQVVALGGGERLTVVGFQVDVVGGAHAPIHAEIPVPHSVGYLVEGALYHPGDSYALPPVRPDTLLVPTAGPWVRIGETIDWIRAIAPRRSVAIHDAMHSEIGRRSSERFLGESGLTGIPLLQLDPGEALDL
jgi:L-ascorbate metabolism protein UlaG (beta-lactamase superfamily)